MSNEPTPDASDADDSASTPSDPASTDDPAASPMDPASTADPTVDMMMSDLSDDSSDDDEPPAVSIDDAPGEFDADEISDPAPASDDVGDEIGGGYIPPQPPPPMVVPPVRRLVRDPYSRLGGVCSGIAHHTGIDVSFVRLGFVLATLFSGIGLILYLLAWLIVPRAEYWPPAPYNADGSGGSILQGRQLAYGLLAIGIVLVIFSGAGGFARMLVSVALVGAGIYLLVQPQTSSDAAPTVPAGTAAPPPPPATPTGSVSPTWRPAPGDVGPDVSADDQASSLPGQIQTEPPASTSNFAAVPPSPVNTVYVPSPVPPRRRRIWPIVLILSLFLIPLLAVVGGIAFLVAADQEFAETDVLVAPTSPAEVPGRIDEGAGTITLDLTSLDVDDFTDSTGAPQEIEIDLNAGEVVVELPEDFPVTVDASAGAGEISVLDRYEEGIRPRITADRDDAVLELDIRVGVGSITVDE